MDASQLNSYLSDPNTVWRARSQIGLVIYGYQDDPRELVEIREVRNFLTTFNDMWPYWAFYFIHVDGSITLLCTCGCAVLVILEWRGGY